MTARLKAFGLFWYDFIIGDDWSVAAGVVIALALIAVVSRTSAPAWWILPVVVIALLPVSVWREIRAERRKDAIPSA
jgi:1,4-dihydroxy-2-naphthoate octaprenyltransferase